MAELPVQTPSDCVPSPLSGASSELPLSAVMHSSSSTNPVPLQMPELCLSSFLRPLLSSLTHSLTGVPASLYPPPFSTATQLSCVFESAAMKIESCKCQRLYGGLPRNILTAHLVCPPCVSCPVPVHSISL